MATTFETLVNNMVNIGFGAAALTAEKGKEVLDVLTAKGEEVREEAQSSDFSRSLSDIFQQAGGAFTDVAARFSASGSTMAERVLDELIVARVRTMTKAQRLEFLAHVRDLVDAVDDATVSVKVESVEVEPDTSTNSEAKDVQ